MEIVVERPEVTPEITALCSKEPALDEEGIRYAIEDASHVIVAKDSNGAVVAFACLDVNTTNDSAELKLLCGTYRIGDKKASELLVKKAEETAKSAGKKSIVLDVLSSDLADKVYKPMGFTMRKDNISMEKVLSGGLRVKKQTRRSKGKRGNRVNRKLRKLTARRR